ncbi:MAG: hypothetical protein Q9M26_04335, partial [Mariprofundales bacterium]|nr:hypothetical protein [Mariprofundales bacterium]
IDAYSNHAVEKKGVYIKELKKEYVYLVNRYAKKGKRKYLRACWKLGSKMAADGLTSRALRRLHKDTLDAILTTRSTGCEGVKVDALLPMLQLIGGYGHANRRDRSKGVAGPAMCERQLYHTVREYLAGDDEPAEEQFPSGMQICLQGVIGDDFVNRMDASSLPAALPPIVDALNADFDRVAEQ